MQKLDEEIKKYQQALDATRQEKNTLSSEVKKIDLTAQKIGAEIKQTQSGIYSAEKSISHLSGEIGNRNIEIKAAQTAIKEDLRRLREQDGYLLELLLSSDNLSSFWSETERLINLKLAISERVNYLAQNKQELSIKKNETETKKKELADLNEKLGDQKIITEQVKKEKDSLLVETKHKETAYQQMLRSRLEKKRQVEEEIRKAENELKIALDPNRLPIAGTSALAWPLSNVRITQYFGNTAFAAAHKTVYNGSSHNGLDLAAAVGTKIMAAESGAVIGAGNTDNTCQGASYGKWILIRHDNGLSTLYAHLSIIKVNEGAQVEKGGLIGYSGNTGYSTGPHLHFTVYATQGVQVGSLKSKVPGCGTYRLPIASTNSYLNPLTYLPKL